MGAGQLAGDGDRLHAGRRRLARAPHRRAAAFARCGSTPSSSTARTRSPTTSRRSSTRRRWRSRSTSSPPSRSTRRATRSSSSASCTRSSAPATARWRAACARRPARSPGATARSSAAWTGWPTSCARDHSKTKLAEAVTLYHVVVEASLAQPGPAHDRGLARGARRPAGLPRGDAQRRARRAAPHRLRRQAAGRPLPARTPDRSRMRSSGCIARSCRGRRRWPSRRTGTASYTECFGFTLEDIGEAGAALDRAALRAIGLPIDTIPRLPDADGPAAARARRPRAEAAAGRASSAPATTASPRTPRRSAIMFDPIAPPGRHRRPCGPARRSSGTSPTPSRGTSSCDNGRSRAMQGHAPHADLTLRLRFADWADVMAGRADPRA